MSAVRIAGPGQTVTLQRGGDAWTVNGNRADTATVTRLWRALAGAEVGRVVATNPDNHERMGLSADSAWTVEFTLADGSTASLVVGKVGPNFPSGFVRLPEQDEVVVVSGDFRPTVVLSVTDWRDKTILRVDTAAVVSIVLESGEGVHVAERADSSWSVDGDPANVNTIRSLLGALSSLDAQGFVEDGIAAEEDPIRVIALGAAADTLAIVLVTEAPDSHHARTPAEATVFEITRSIGNRLTPDIAALRAADVGGV